MVKVKTNSLYHRPKRSLNKIWMLETKFEFEKKNKFSIPARNAASLIDHNLRLAVSPISSTQLVRYLMYAGLYRSGVEVWGLEGLSCTHFLPAFHWTCEMPTCGLMASSEGKCCTIGAPKEALSSTRASSELVAASLSTALARYSHRIVHAAFKVDPGESGAQSSASDNRICTEDRELDLCQHRHCGWWVHTLAIWVDSMTQV